MWVCGQPPARAAQPARHLGKPQSSVPGTERSCPSSCTIYKYSDHRKRDVSEGTVHCALLSRVAQPLGVVATKGVQTGGPGVRVAPRQSLGSRGLRAAGLARLSEWGQLGNPGAGTGATKWRPGGTSGEEAAGRLHGGGPSSLLLYTNRAGVGPPAWQVDVGRRARVAAAAGLRAAILQDILDGGHSAPLLE